MLPVVGSKKTERDLDKLYKSIWKLKEIRDKFEPFEIGHWRFRNEKMDTVMSMLSLEERIEFDADVRNIDWPQYLHDYC
jgi:hypothetical protein